MTIDRRALALLLSLVALALVAPGCGDDEESDVTVPSISVPDATTTSVPEATITEPSTVPDGGTTTDPGVEDSPENDVPPPPGSPQEAFEQACKKNPAACG